MSTIFDRLTSNAVTIPEIVKAMILIAAIPRKFDHLSSHLLQVYTTATLMFNVVRDAINAESQRRYANGNPRQPVINKISTVKHKGANPRWQPQSQGDNKGEGQSSPCPNSNNDKGKGKPHGKRAGKAVKAKHAHLASITSGSGHQILNSSHAPVFTTITGSSTIIRPMLEKHISTPLLVPYSLPLPVQTPSVKDPCKQQPAQHFISTSPSDSSSSSVYPDYQ